MSNVMDGVGGRVAWTLPLEPAGLYDAPHALSNWPSNFSSFNPTLLSSSDSKTILLFFRVSNMHFCGAQSSWRDAVRKQTHIRSYIAAADLDARTLKFRTRPAVLRSASHLFRAEGTACEQWVDAGGGVQGTFSGPEDPRAVWSPGPRPLPWLLTSAWSDDCARLRVHLIKLPPPQRDGTRHDGQRPQQVPLFVDEWPMSPATSTHQLAHPESQPLQKNWLPFVHDGDLYAGTPLTALRGTRSAPKRAESTSDVYMHMCM